MLKHTYQKRTNQCVHRRQEKSKTKYNMAFSAHDSRLAQINTSTTDRERPRRNITVLELYSLRLVQTIALETWLRRRRGAAKQWEELIRMSRDENCFVTLPVWIVRFQCRSLFIAPSTCFILFYISCRHLLRVDRGFHR